MTDQKTDKTPEVFLSPYELCDRWGGTVVSGTLANWRNKKKGPPFTKIGGKVRYRLSDVIKYEQENTKNGG